MPSYLDRIKPTYRDAAVEFPVELSPPIRFLPIEEGERRAIVYVRLDALLAALNPEVAEAFQLATYSELLAEVERQISCERERVVDVK